jgi:hypothetical protein
MEFGVSFELHESVYIEPDVTLSRDVTNRSACGPQGQDNGR